MNTQAWIEALGWTLVLFLWQGAAVAALLWIFLQFVSSQRRPQLRYLAGCGSLLLLVALAAGTFARESAKARKPRVEIAAARTPPASLPAVAISQPPIAAPAAAPAPVIPASISIPPESDPIVPTSPTWASLADRLKPLFPGIVAAWGIGVGLGFLRLCRCWNKVQRIRRSGQPLEESPWPDSLGRLCDFLRLSRPVRLVASAAVQVPIVIGWLKPVILLPCSIVTGLPREQVEAIIAHELAHIRRHDYFINVLQNVIETLFFFHPAVWWISGQIRREREHCCDDLAALACGGVLPYVTALTALEEACGAEQRLTVAANGGSLLARVRRLLAAAPAEGPGNGSYVATVAALALIAAVALPLVIGQEPAAAPAIEEAPKPTPKPTEANVAFRAVPIPGRYAQTRELLGLWKVEFRRPKPYFAIAINGRIQRKSPRGKPVGGAPPKAREVRFKETQLEHPDRETPSIPPGAFRRLIKHVDQYIARFPGEEAEKFRDLLPQLKANQSRTLEETSTLLDQFCDVATLPVHWQAVEEQSRTFEGKTPKEQVLANPQEDLPYGPASPMGLRAAWIFRPMKDEYAMGEAPTSRVIIHNAGTAPVEFIANARLQDSRWSVVDANGTPVKLNETRWARAGEQRSRLAPGESLELPAFGLGIGPGDFDHVYEVSAIGMKLPARAGDEFRCKWEVNLQAAWTVGDDDAAKPVPVKLETGEVKFRVSDPPADGPKPLGIATQGGFYVIAPGVKLRITRLRLGPPSIIVNGREKLPSAGDRKEVKELNFADLELASDRSKHISIRLPNGDNSYVIAWERGGRTLWVGEADWVRKMDISTAGRFPTAEILESVDPLKREEVEKFLQNAGTGVPEQRWKWEDPGDFGGIPAHVKAALIQHRPKADANAVAPEATYPLDAADPRLPWHASGEVKDAKGQPMPDVEIWVHTGFGSLKRTGFVKTDANGRYRVNFGPGVLMEKDSPQLQVANITAHRPGFFEKNLNRHGQGAAAMRDVPAESLKDYGVTVEQFTLPNSPRQVDFVMLPSVTLKGKLVGTGSFPKLPPQDYRAKGSELTFVDREERNRTPLASWQVWLTGPKLPPGCSVFASAETDKEGRFEFKDVPAGFEWQIQADTHHRNRDPRSPLFKVNASEDSVIEVELDEKQTGLRFAPIPRKSAEAAANEWRVQVVEGETGEPLKGAPIKFTRIFGPTNHPPEETRTDSNGYFRLRLPSSAIAVFEVNVANRWAPGALWVGGNSGSGEVLHPDPSKPKIVPVWKGTRVKGRLLQPDASPLPDATLNIGAYVDHPEWMGRAGLELNRRSSNRGDSQNWGVFVKTAADGSFETTVPSPEARNWIRVNTMEIAFGITAPQATRIALSKCAPFTVEDRARENQSAERNGELDFGDLRLKKGIVLRGRVEDADGRPIAGIGLATSLTQGTYGGRSIRSGANGQFEFLPMTAGPIRLIANTHFAHDGIMTSQNAPRIFAAQQVMLPEGTEVVDVVIRSLPHVTVEFEWVDRRKPKGLVSSRGGFSVSGTVPVIGGGTVRWDGFTEVVSRAGKKFLVVKLPANIVDPTLALLADSVVTPSYEDDRSKLGPGTHTVRDFSTPMRRVIYGDEPPASP